MSSHCTEDSPQARQSHRQMQNPGADQPEPCRKCLYVNSNCMLQPSTSNLKSVNVAELVLFYCAWLPRLYNALSLVGKQRYRALCNGRRHRVWQPSKERRKGAALGQRVRLAERGHAPARPRAPCSAPRHAPARAAGQTHQLPLGQAARPAAPPSARLGHQRNCHVGAPKRTCVRVGLDKHGHNEHSCSSSPGARKPATCLHGSRQRS